MDSSGVAHGFSRLLRCLGRKKGLTGPSLPKRSTIQSTKAEPEEVLRIARPGSRMILGSQGVSAASRESRRTKSFVVCFLIFLGVPDNVRSFGSTGPEATRLYCCHQEGARTALHGRHLTIANIGWTGNKP